MTDDRRALLEAIAFGRDPNVKPGDRLRALEMLDHLDPEEMETNFRAELASLSGVELDAHLDALLGREIVVSALAGAGRFPVMETALADAIEERVRGIADRRPTDPAATLNSNDTHT